MSRSIASSTRTSIAVLASKWVSICAGEVQLPQQGVDASPFCLRWTPVSLSGDTVSGRSRTRSVIRGCKPLVPNRFDLYIEADPIRRGNELIDLNPLVVCLPRS